MRTWRSSSTCAETGFASEENDFHAFRDEAVDAMASGRWQSLYARPSVGRFQVHFTPMGPFS